MLIKELLLSYYNTQCLLTVAELNIADHLEKNSKSITELAILTHTYEDKLYRVMRFMAEQGVFDELPNKIFSINQESKLLLSDSVENLNDFIRLHGKYFYPAATELLQNVGSNKSSFEIKFGKSAGQYFIDHPEAGEIYNTAMKNNSEMMGKRIAEIYNFTPYPTIIDIGGGIGSLIAKILTKYPTHKGINFDIPELQTKSEQYLKSQGIAARCQYIGGSFFDGVPENGDLYILKAILHGKDDEKAIQILKHCHRVMHSTGKLILITRVITPGQHYADACVNDINMLNATSGENRSLETFETLLTKAGFSITDVIHIEGSHHIIEAQKQK